MSALNKFHAAVTYLNSIPWEEKGRFKTSADKKSKAFIQYLRGFGGAIYSVKLTQECSLQFLANGDALKEEDWAERLHEIERRIQAKEPLAGFDRWDWEQKRENERKRIERELEKAPKPRYTLIINVPTYSG